MSVFPSFLRTAKPALTFLCFALLSCRSPVAPLVAVIPETTAQEVWESEHAGADRAAQALGWSAYWNGPSREDDIARQIQIVDNAIAHHVDGIVISPDHSLALISPIRAALARGIPTVVVGSPLLIPPGANLFFVINDDAAMGHMAAARVQGHVQNGGTVAVLGVYPGILSLVRRADAFEDSLRKAVPAVRIVERHSTSFEFAEAEQTDEETIRANSDLRAILTLDIVQTRAAYTALSATGNLGRIVLVACDQDLDLERMVRTGAIDAIVAQNTSVMGYDAVQLIAQARKGKTTGASRVIAPMLITRENIDTPEVQQVLDMNWSVH